MTAGAAGHARQRPPGVFLRRCARWDAALANVETLLLAILILGSLAASLVQIALRNLGLPALPETDTAVRRALLWIAFIGASLAAFRGSHLAVDVAEQVLPARANRVVSAAAGLVAAAVTALLALSSARFVVAELAFAGPGAAAAAAVMPLGFAVITLRFLLGAARRLTGSDGEPPDKAAQRRPAGGSGPHPRLRSGAEQDSASQPAGGPVPGGARRRLGNRGPSTRRP